MRQMPIDEVTGQTYMDLYCRLQRAINVARIKKQTEYAVDMVLTINEINDILYAFKQWLREDYGCTYKDFTDAYKKAFDEDQDIERTEAIAEDWKRPLPKLEPKYPNGTKLDIHGKVI